MPILAWTVTLYDDDGTETLDATKLATGTGRTETEALNDLLTYLRKYDRIAQWVKDHEW